MATLDPTTQTITLRIVFDGLGMAGKTTNLRQIYDILSSSRRGDLYIPEERRGRTMYFDWLEIEAGQIEEHRLRCQLLTVPGQFSYAQRRWHLLNTPDAVVAVVDSTPQGIVKARYALHFLRDAIAHHQPPVPLLVQANKQDAAGALPGAEVIRELHLPEKIRVIEASALHGDGVRATLVFALQAARERLRRVLDEGGLAALPSKTETAEDVYHQLLDQEVSNVESHEGEILADRVLERLRPGEAPADETQAAARSLPPPSEPPEPPSTLPSAQPGQLVQAPPEPVSSGPTPSTPTPSTPAPSASEPPAELPHDALERSSPRWSPPWQVWPAAGGRLYLQEMREDGALQRRERAGAPEHEVEFQTARWSLLVAPAERHRDRKQGTLALREMAEAIVSAGDLLPSPLCLVLQQVGAEESQLWVVRRKIEPAFREGEARTLEALEHLCAYVAKSVALGVRRGVLLSLDPAALGYLKGANAERRLVSLARPAPITSWGPDWLAPLLAWWVASSPSTGLEEACAMLTEAVRNATTKEELARIEWLENLDMTARKLGQHGMGGTL